MIPLAPIACFILIGEQRQFFSCFAAKNKNCVIKNKIIMFTLQLLSHPHTYLFVAHWLFAPIESSLGGGAQNTVIRHASASPSFYYTSHINVILVILTLATYDKFMLKHAKILNSFLFFVLFIHY